MKDIITTITAVIICLSSLAQENPYVYKKNGKLIYVADEKGNRIPDYSNVGYQLGENDLPNVEVKITVITSYSIHYTKLYDI